jgi:hypothetical protein
VPTSAVSIETPAKADTTIFLKFMTLSPFWFC